MPNCFLPFPSPVYILKKERGGERERASELCKAPVRGRLFTWLIQHWLQGFCCDFRTPAGLWEG